MSDGLEVGNVFISGSIEDKNIRFVKIMHVDRHREIVYAIVTDGFLGYPPVCCHFNEFLEEYSYYGR